MCVRVYVCLCVWCTHAAIDRLAADSGLTSATSLAFCIAVFWLAASSCSSSSYWRRRESFQLLDPSLYFHKLACKNNTYISRKWQKQQSRTKVKWDFEASCILQMFKKRPNTLYLCCTSNKRENVFFLGLILYLGELLGVGQIVDSDGQEDVKQSVCGGRS